MFHSYFQFVIISSEISDFEFILQLLENLILLTTDFIGNTSNAFKKVTICFLNFGYAFRYPECLVTKYRSQLTHHIRQPIESMNLKISSEISDFELIFYLKNLIFLTPNFIGNTSNAFQKMSGVFPELRRCLQIPRMSWYDAQK